MTTRSNRCQAAIAINITAKFFAGNVIHVSTRKKTNMLTPAPGIVQTSKRKRLRRNGDKKTNIADRRRESRRSLRRSLNIYRIPMSFYYSNECSGLVDDACLEDSYGRVKTYSFCCTYFTTTTTLDHPPIRSRPVGRILTGIGMDTKSDGQSGSAEGSPDSKVYRKRNDRY